MVYSSKLCDYYVELARLPCSQISFVGSDMRFSTEYEVLEFELDKTQSIHGASLPDWIKVLEVCECLLRQHSKDLRVAAWLTWALHQRESFPGLLAGLGLMRYLCEHHWAQVFPKKPRTRGAVLGWLVLRLEPLFAQSLPLQDQQPLFQSVLEHLACLDDLWTRQLGDEAPSLLPMRRQLAQKLEHAERQGDTPSTVPVAPAKQAVTQPFSIEPVIDNEKDAHKWLRALQEQARPLSAWWQRQNAGDLRAQRLNRTLVWLALTRCPDADSERITALRGPAPDKLTHYQERFVQGHYADLLIELETSLAGSMFWFDGVRIAWECLQALHADLAMTELEVSFALLLQRLPTLPEFRFHDGTPFADAATRDWISLQVNRHLQAPELPGVQVEARAEPWESALQAVMPRLRKDGLKVAVSELKQGLHAARSERARFHWRLAMARLCVLAGKQELAKVQLEQLDDELQQAGIDRWEPELALQVAQLLYRCCEQLPQSHAVRERKEDTHRKLCRFDLEAVLE
ncbi:type VI secretion system protein TssA [Pseudomonas sp. B6002]|uniref:type VI secretion system protein TssA n=1 Tax=Pseudomonas sp. B6002 TaxID=2726978 RepID=UPI0015A14330|nr:type VI secretion system protein TssA [Pseudomonas sp. B6002]NVZ50482.1 type VI secretion system protein TssA [Pseudomonas sp. B6002]